MGVFLFFMMGFLIIASGFILLGITFYQWYKNPALMTRKKHIQK